MIEKTCLGYYLNLILGNHRVVKYDKEDMFRRLLELNLS